jgi:uncharacterized protein (DUF433 family)
MNLPDFLTQSEDGSIRLTGHRIDLWDVVVFYNEGYSAEMLAGQFPTLPLPVIHKAIAFYLENQSEVDAYVHQCEGEVEGQRAAAKKGPSLAELRQRLDALTRSETPNQ